MSEECFRRLGNCSSGAKKVVADILKTQSPHPSNESERKKKKNALNHAPPPWSFHRIAKYFLLKFWTWAISKNGELWRCPQRRKKGMNFRGENSTQQTIATKQRSGNKNGAKSYIGIMSDPRVRTEQFQSQGFIFFPFTVGYWTSDESEKLFALRRHFLSCCSREQNEQTNKKKQVSSKKILSHASASKDKRCNFMGKHFLLMWEFLTKSEATRKESACFLPKRKQRNVERFQKSRKPRAQADES